MISTDVYLAPSLMHLQVSRLWIVGVVQKYYVIKLNMQRCRHTNRAECILTLFDQVRGEAQEPLHSNPPPYTHLPGAKGQLTTAVQPLHKGECSSPDLWGARWAKEGVEKRGAYHARAVL